MRYWGPINSTGGIFGNDGYVDGNPAIGQQGSIPTFRTFEQTMRELQNFIAACGLTPDDVMNGIQVGQAIQTSKVKYAQDIGTVNAIAVTLVPLPFGYVAGFVVRTRMAHTNTSDTVTINVNGMGIRNVVKPTLALLSPGDLIKESIVELAYDGTRFQLISWNGVSFLNTKKIVFDVPGIYTYVATANGPHKWSVWSAGGGGGSGIGAAVSSGGSAGSFSEKVSLHAVGQSITVTVPSGGEPSIQGGAASVTWVGPPSGSVTVLGGPGGISSSTYGAGTNSPDPPTKPTDGDRNIQGQQGQPGFNPVAPSAQSGAGGAAPLGGLGGTGGGGGAGSGTAPGGGGGGSAAGQAPGIGARGEIWVEF